MGEGWWSGRSINAVERKFQECYFGEGEKRKRMLAVLAVVE